jgi:hypothetical protein
MIYYECARADRAWKCVGSLCEARHDQCVFQAYRSHKYDEAHILQ